MKKSAIIPIAILFALALGAGAFWGGMNIGKAQAQNDQNAFFAGRGFDPNNLPAGGAAGSGGAGRAAGGGGFSGAGGQGPNARGVFGTISSVNGNTVTVTDNQGGTVTVNLSGSTVVVKSVLGSTSDLKVGGHILVRGDRSGNNIAAKGIQISDQPAGVGDLFPAFGGPRGRATATPTPAK